MSCSFRSRKTLSNGIIGWLLLPQLRLQIAQFRHQRRDLRFETLHADRQRLACGGWVVFDCRRFDYGAADRVRPARFFLARTARELADDGVVARAEPLQGRFHVIDRFERVEAVAASAELAGGLRSAEKEQRDDRLGGTIEMPRRVEIVIPTRSAAAEDFPDQLLVLEAVERALYLALPHLHDRLAVRFLIARRDERVAGEPGGLGRRQLLLHRAAEAANLAGVGRARGQPPRLAFAIERGDGVG